MPHSHFVGATCIDFQFVSPWLWIISYIAKREFTEEEEGWVEGFSFWRCIGGGEGGRLSCLSQYKWCFDKKSLVSQYFFIKLCTNLIDEDRCLAEYVEQIVYLWCMCVCECVLCLRFQLNVVTQPT